MTASKRASENVNQFKCIACGKIRLRGQYVVTKSGKFKGYESHVCKADACQTELATGRAWSKLLKGVFAAMLIGMFTGCGKAPQTNIIGLQEKTIMSQWVPDPDASNPATIPIDGITLTGASYSQLKQVPFITSAGASCTITALVDGDETIGSVQLSGCSGQSLTVTYQRIGTQNMELCNGTTCGLYQ